VLIWINLKLDTILLNPKLLIWSKYRATIKSKWEFSCLYPTEALHLAKPVPDSACSWSL